MGTGLKGSSTNTPIIDAGTISRSRMRPPGAICTSDEPTAASTAVHSDPHAFVRLAIAKVPVLKGYGIVLIDQGSITLLRAPCATNRSVVFEFHAAQGALSAPRKAPAQASTMWDELINLGFNCSGATLSWVGVVGFSAAAPATGGLSVAGATLAWGGAIASTGQCVAFGVRVYNEFMDDAAANQRMSNNPYYENAMRAADIVGLAGAGVALKEAKLAHKALNRAGSSWRQSGVEQLARPMRRKLTSGLSLIGAKRVQSDLINLVVKKKLLEAVGGGIGFAGSIYAGVVNETSVWVIEAGESGDGGAMSQGGSSVPEGPSIRGR